MQRYVDEGKLAALLTIIARRGKVAHFETYGYMDKESATPMKKDTIFRIASLTKQVTSVAILMLFEEGRFQHDVLGYLVEIISGMPLNRFLTQRIFNPLKMKDTGFHVPSVFLSLESRLE